MPSMTAISELIRLIPSFLLRCRVVTNFHSTIPQKKLCLSKNKSLHRKTCVVLLSDVTYWFNSGWYHCSTQTQIHLGLGIPEFSAINIHSAIWLMRELSRTGEFLSMTCISECLFELLSRCEQSAYKELQVYGKAVIKQLIQAWFEFSKL